MRAVLWTMLSLLVFFAVFAAWASRSAIHPIEAPVASAFAQADIALGGNLAALGNCNNCHTAPGSRVFAGGRAVPTPFGIVYSTNITPDLMTGILSTTPASRASIGRRIRSCVSHPCRTASMCTRPGEPFLGTGESAQGPAAAAVANAIANATGKRLRDLPFTRERVRTA